MKFTTYPRSEPAAPVKTHPREIYKGRKKKPGERDERINPTEPEAFDNLIECRALIEDIGLPDITSWEDGSLRASWELGHGYSSHIVFNTGGTGKHETLFYTRNHKVEPRRIQTFDTAAEAVKALKDILKASPFMQEEKNIREAIRMLEEADLQRSADYVRIIAKEMDAWEEPEDWEYRRINLASLQSYIDFMQKIRESGHFPDMSENGISIRQNAAPQNSTWRNGDILKMWAEDSGLEVDCEFQEDGNVHIGFLGGTEGEDMQFLDGNHEETIQFLRQRGHTLKQKTVDPMVEAKFEEHFQEALRA